MLRNRKRQQKQLREIRKTMAFRTYAWFYGNDYQLINIHDARQKDHPYYGDEQLYGATDVHSFSTYNFIREVTQRVVVSTDKKTQGNRTIYVKGTPEWNAKFNNINDERHSNEIIYEEYKERPDGWFEFEIPLGFTSVDLFESVTTAKRLAEILIVMYMRDDKGTLIPAYQHVFQDFLVSDLDLDLLHCLLALYIPIFWENRFASKQKFLQFGADEMPKHH
jgi:type VI protein secretion system component Hcp